MSTNKPTSEERRPVQVRIPRLLKAETEKYFADHGGNFQKVLEPVVCAELARLIGMDRVVERSDGHQVARSARASA